MTAHNIKELNNWKKPRGLQVKQYQKLKETLFLMNQGGFYKRDRY
jgi:hypothetical protein